MGASGDEARKQAGGAASPPPEDDCAMVARLCGPSIDAELGRAQAARIAAHCACCARCRLLRERERACAQAIAGSLRRGGQGDERRWRLALAQALASPAAGRAPRRPARWRERIDVMRWCALAASLLFLAALASAGLGLRHSHSWMPLDRRGGGCGAALAARMPPSPAARPPAMPSSSADHAWTAPHDRSPA